MGYGSRRDFDIDQSLDTSTYLGVELSGDGVKTVKEKVEPVLQAPIPQNTGELSSFLGAVTFYARFVADMSKVTAPLHKLLQKGRKWQWTEVEEGSFNELKQRLVQATVLAHYDGRRPVRLTEDAVSALAAARMQRWALALAAYTYDVEYRKAEEIPMADFCHAFQFRGRRSWLR